MKHDVTVKITAGTQRDAEEIARAVEELSGLFSATEWKAISVKAAQHSDQAAYTGAYGR